MNASIVYEVAKALPKEERRKLFNMLKEEMKPIRPKTKTKASFTDEDALDYLLKNLNILPPKEDS